MNDVKYDQDCLHEVLYRHTDCMVHVWYRNDLFGIIGLHNTVLKRKLFVVNYTRYSIYVRRLQIEYTTSHHRIATF